MRGLDDFWAGYDATLARIRAERPSTVDGVAAILNEFQSPSAGVAFFGNNADDRLSDALADAGWQLRFLEQDYLWEARHPGSGEWLHYVEGDVYPGPWTEPQYETADEDVKRAREAVLAEQLNLYEFDIAAVVTLKVRAKTEDQARSMIDGLRSISARTTGEDIETVHGLDVSTGDYDVVNVSPLGRGYLVSAQTKDGKEISVSEDELIPEPILAPDRAGIMEDLAEADRALAGDSIDAVDHALHGLAERVRGLLDDNGNPHTEKSGRYIVTSPLGSRTWHADDADHAAGQHRDAFPDEPVISVRPAAGELQARSAVSQPGTSATPDPGPGQEAPARTGSPARAPRPAAAARKPARPQPGQQVPPRTRRRS